MALPIYILARVPGASGTTEWTDIPELKRRQRFVFINHAPLRDTSRWVSVDRKRPFEVATFHRRHNWQTHSYHATLAAAQKAAQRLAKDLG